MKQDNESIGNPDRSGQLFDYLCEKYKLETDSALAKWLGLNRSTISRVRNGHADVSLETRLAIIHRGVDPKKVDKLIGTPPVGAVKLKQQEERVALRQRIKIARISLRALPVTVSNLDAVEKLVKASGL